MKKYVLYCIAILLFISKPLFAQESLAAYNDRVKKYVEQYYPLAIAEQRSNGIPASVTLGQGILETDGGTSDLMTLANNHFGIKCTSNWTGETISHDDETDNECFKKYKCAADSYRDHSDHLKTNPRYKPLFNISPTDYAGWAICLKKCGYATNPLYAQRLIKIIEDFRLQEYTYSAMDSASNFPINQEIIKKAYPSGNAMRGEDTAIAASQPEDMTPLQKIADSARYIVTQKDKANTRTVTATPDTTIEMNTLRNVDSSKIVNVNGMKAFYVYKDEMLLPYAVKYHIRYARLLEMNDLQDGPAPFNMFIYLEKKLTYGVHESHKVEAGESLMMISQLEGVQLKKIMALNQLNPNEEPVPGTILELQKPAVQKPEVKIMETIAHKDNAIVSGSTGDPRPASDYITINKPQANAKKPAQTNKTDTTPDIVPIEKPVANTKSGTKKNPTEREIWEKQQKAHNDSLAALKAELDKEVYVDNSKPAPASQNTRKAKYTLDGDDKNQEPQNGDYITIQKGETLSAIAAKNHISVKQLLKWNNVEPDKIKFGQKLRVTDPGNDNDAGLVQKDKDDEGLASPAQHGEPSAAKGGYYEIQKGETLSAIARKNNITVKQLLEWNSDIDADKIRSGQKLRVTEPRKTENTPGRKTETAQKKGKGDKYYVIQKGETLSAIARKNNISVKQLLEWNDDVDADKIRDGQKLRVAE